MSRNYAATSVHSSRCTDRGPAQQLNDYPESSRTNLIVRRLDPRLNDEDLFQLFSQFGPVASHAVMRDIHTGVSTGTAFVRFCDHAGAVRALDAFSRSRPSAATCAVPPLSVQWARRQHDDTPSGADRRHIMKLFVRNVPVSVTVPELEAYFRQFGPLSHATIHRDTSPVGDRRLERHIAFVIFTAEGAAECAANGVHNTTPFEACRGIPFMVKLAEDKERRRHGATEVPALRCAPLSPVQPCASVDSGSLRNGTSSGASSMHATSSRGPSTPPLSYYNNPYSLHTTRVLCNPPSFAADRWLTVA